MTPREPSSDAVAVTVSGWVLDDGGSFVLCPWEPAEACLGIPTDGWDALPEDGPLRASGSYDGRSLTVESAEPWTPYERGHPFNPCTGERSRRSPEHIFVSDVNTVLAGHEDRLAGMWIAGGDTVVALTGPDDDLAAELRDLDDRVCVETGYTDSVAEREGLASEISLRLLEAGSYVLERWDSVTDGPLRLHVEQIDSATMETIADTYGDDLALTAFIEVHDAPLEALPDQQPPVPADVVIPTAASRGGPSMMAMWSGVVLSFDADANCLFIRNGAQRLVVVWPFGFSAMSGDPTVVYDAAGDEYARTGVPFDLGGGEVDIEVVAPDERCGATTAWQTAGPTEWELERILSGQAQDD